jgi:hypothetical protein
MVVIRTRLLRNNHCNYNDRYDESASALPNKRKQEVSPLGFRVPPYRNAVQEIRWRMERSRSRSDGLGDIPIRDEQGCVVDGEGCGWGLGGDVVGVGGKWWFYTHKKVLGIPFQRHFGALFLCVHQPLRCCDTLSAAPVLAACRTRYCHCVHKRMA